MRFGQPPWWADAPRWHQADEAARTLTLGARSMKRLAAHGRKVSEALLDVGRAAAMSMAETLATPLPTIVNPTREGE